MTTRIKLRRDTAANWTTNNPVLALGEAGYDTTNNQLRVGDGTTVWSGLEAIGGGISSNIAIAPEFGPEVRFARPEDVATDAVNAVDVIDTGVALGRNSEHGGLLNTLEDSLDGYGSGSGQSYVGQPTHTEWNTDGWADLSNVTTRIYDDFRDMRQSFPNEDAMVGAEIVMHDTLNDKYYTFKFNRWSMGDNGGDGGYSYVRRLINHTQYFTRLDDDYGTTDTVDTGLIIARGNNGGIYNDDSEASWDRDVSPQGTEWNIDGWSDLSNLLTRTYTNFASAFSYQIGERVVGKEAIMHDTINDNYYAVKFLRWGGSNGAGFTWQRRLIDTTQLDEGVHFADGTVQTTAGITLNSDGSFELPGGLVLPTQINMGYDVTTTLNAPTLQLSNDNNNQVVITGPAATADNSYAQRIVIQGQRGYGSTSTQGEGGDIYIWGGVGGESNNNTEGWGYGGGSGGDVKLRGGEGLNDDGGYVRIEGGNVAHFSTSTTGDAGFVEITGGDVVEDNNAVSSLAGNVTITGGRAYSATTQSGVVGIVTGGTTNPDVAGENYWEFGNSGTLTFPEGSILSGTRENVTVTLDQFNDGGFTGPQVFSKVSDILYQVLPSGPTMELVSGAWYLKVGVATYYNSTDLMTWAESAGGLPTPVGTIGTLATTNLTLDANTWTFSGNGGLTFPDSTVQTTAYVDNRTTGSWTLATGSNTVSITVPLNGNYQMWVNGNIPNGIVEWNATVNVSNPNVPAIGSQHAWWYYDGNALVLTAIPDQIVGTTGVISTSSSYAGTASNVFTFGITNNSTSTQVVTWGYTTL